MNYKDQITSSDKNKPKVNYEEKLKALIYIILFSEYWSERINRNAKSASDRW